MIDSNVSLQPIKTDKQFAFPNRFKSFPIVVSTCFWISENYNKLKESNYVTKCTCKLAESTIKNSIDLATPIIDKFKDKVDVLDSLACNQLDKLEAAFPIIKKKPDDIVHQGKELISNWTHQPYALRLYNVKNLAKNKQLNEDKTEINVLNEMKQPIHSNQGKIFLLNYKNKLIPLFIYDSLRFHLKKCINYSIRIIKTYILNIFKLIESYKLLKKNAFTKLQDKLYVTKDKIDLYKEYLDLLSKQFMVQDGRSLEHVYSLEEKTKIIVRRNIGNLITIFRILFTKVQQLKPIIEQNRITIMISHLIADIYQIINKSDGSFIDLVNSLLIESTQAINKIENLKIFINNLSSSLIQWIVPNFDAFGVLDDFEDDLYEIEQEFIVSQRKQNFNNHKYLNKSYVTKYLEFHRKDLEICESDSDLAVSTNRSISSFSSSIKRYHYYNSLSNNSSCSLNASYASSTHSNICSSY